MKEYASYRLTVCLRDKKSCEGCPILSTVMFGYITFCPVVLKEIKNFKRPVICPLKEVDDGVSVER